MKKARPVSSLRDEAIYRPIIAKYLAEIDEMHEMMKLDDIKIAESFAKSQKILEEIKAMRAVDELKRSKRKVA